MKNSKTQRQYSVPEENNQLVIILNSEIKLPKDAPVRETSAQLEELDYTKLYFAYSGIRKSQIEPRVLFKVLVCAYIYAKETRTEVREGRCGFRL